MSKLINGRFALKPILQMKTSESKPDMYDLLMVAKAQEQKEDKEKTKQAQVSKLCKVCKAHRGDGKGVNPDKTTYRLCGFCSDGDRFMWCEECDLHTRMGVAARFVKCYNCDTVLLKA